jgi:hypothetical protein
MQVSRRRLLAFGAAPLGAACGFVADLFSWWIDVKARPANERGSR